MEFKERNSSTFKRIFIIEMDSKATLIDYPGDVIGISTLNFVDSILTLQIQLKESKF